MNKSTFAIICGLIFLFTLFSNTTLAQNAYTRLCNQGLEYEKMGNLDGAISKYTDAIITNPELWSGYSYRASAYYKKQKYDDAIIDISQAINLSPETISLYKVRAECYEEKGIYDKAIKDFDLYLLAKPDDIRAIYYQGSSFLKVRDTTNAKTNALRIIELEPVREVFFSGEHLLDIYDLEIRRKIVKQLLEDAHAYMEEEKSIASKSLGNIKLTGAFQKLNNAWLYSSGIEKEDRDLKSTILKDIFFVYPKMKDKPDIPEIARKYMVQATSATGEKKYKDAIALWNKVLDISPYFSMAYFNNALLRELSGDNRNSIVDMKKYLELYPDAPDARGAKDKIYEWEGKVQLLEEIVKKYSVANKLDKITNLSTIKITAKSLSIISDMKLRTNIEIWMKNPDKIKTVITAKGYKTVSVFDGEKGYSIDGSKAPVEMTPDQAKETSNSIVFQNRMANYLENRQLSLEGEEKVNDKPTFKIKVKGENIAYMYIDKESYLLVKSSAFINQGGKTYKYDSYPSDYTETNGVFLPMNQTTISPLLDGGEYTTTTTYEKVEVNIPMEDTIFKVEKNRK